MDAPVERLAGAGARAGQSFTHLHVHTEYSMLDGAARVGDVVAAAAADGQPALGITDHGNMYGVLDFYKACRDQGIKPIIGSELYMAHEQPHRAPAAPGPAWTTPAATPRAGAKLYYHLTAAGRERRPATRTSSSSPAGPSSRATTTSPGSTGSCSSRAPRGPHRHHRLPRRPRAAGPAASDDQRGALKTGRPAAGHLRARQPLRRAPGPRHPRAAPHQPAAARDRPASSARRCSPPTTATTPTASDADRPRRPRCACRPAR